MNKVPYLALKKPSLTIFSSELSLTHFSNFVKTCEAHTLLRTIIWLFIPASVHLYTDLSGFKKKKRKVPTLLYSAKRCNLLPLMLINCSVLIMSSCFEWGPWENNGSALASELKHSCQDSWCTHFTWNSYTPVYCSLRTIVFWLVTYSSVFVETSGAHTVLGTVIAV
jgi:hypothetical protein